jgi:hypothetical protein
MPRLILKIIPFLFIIFEYIFILLLYLKVIFSFSFLIDKRTPNPFYSLLFIIVAFLLMIIRLIILNSKHNYKVFLLFIYHIYFFYVFENARRGDYFKQFAFFIFISVALYYFDYFILEFLKTLSKKKTKSISS